MAFVPFAPIDDNVSDPGDLVSVEAFGALATNINCLVDSMPPGVIIPVLTGFAGVPTPDPRLWQLCDGSVVTNPDSPLRGHTTPDYVDPGAGADGGRYMRGYISPGTIGFYGGANLQVFSHNHGGNTDDFATPPANSDTDDDFMSVIGHHHSIPVGLASPINFEPVHIRVHHYIKIL